MTRIVTLRLCIAVYMIFQFSISKAQTEFSNNLNGNPVNIGETVTVTIESKTVGKDIYFETTNFSSNF